jgi:hypothetical protein
LAAASPFLLEKRGKRNMEMARLQLFQNKYQYPKYSAALTAYGSSLDCTPVGIGLKNGILRVELSMDEAMACNYLSLTRGNSTIYAWIDDVKMVNDLVMEISYSVDSWRTFKNKIDLGVQFIRRSPVVTYLPDKLLGSTKAYHDISSTSYVIGSTTQRTAVIQVRADGSEAISNTPVQPTPYQFYFTNFNVNSWQDNQALTQLMHQLPQNAQTENLVTIYSIPYIDISGLGVQDLILYIENQDPITISGFKMASFDTDLSGLLYHETPIVIDNVNSLFQSGHSLQVIIPEAGILPISDELLGKGDIKLRQDIDLFSGACNYMLTSGSNADGNYNIYGNSVRGSSVSSIPILSNPEDTYISQNQNSLTTSLIGDVANVAIGLGMMGAGPLGRFMGATDIMSKQFGSSIVAQGGVGMMENWAQRQDGGGLAVNPPAFLGTALASNFNGTFWVVKTVQHVDNASLVHSNYGYPYNMIDTLTFPTSGYIETQACDVSSSDGSVPRWALEDINTLFDNGILVK